ncbi:uncharacterized protein LOC105382861 [Plutella xylostella]|uniref:uncharacterized protein LOC105382861 n=1 Tax=Plutella xylostella TaxID=51655 RepID=UPI00203306E1|nr:uncharacterized protein LOC105382861 [Plutella xylostella]
MELSVDQFIDGLLTKEAAERPSDSAKPEDIKLELPPWYDEKLFNKGRSFYWSNCFSLATSMFIGLIAVFSIPSILRVLVGSQRSSSCFTAYRRYLSTMLHTTAWFQHELRPPTESWKSLEAVRTRHARASRASCLRGGGPVSQRDIALTQFGFLGFAVLRPTKFGLRGFSEDDWEAYNHFWRVIGYMIGLEDRYNICRKNIHETRQVLQILLDRVFTPCLTNVPEHFEHMSRVMIDGLWSVNPTVNTEAALYYTKYMANVPGYVYTEEERIAFQIKLKGLLKDQPIDCGIRTEDLIEKPAIEGLPDTPLPLLYYKDYDVLDNVPTYKNLTWFERYKLNSNTLFMQLYSTNLGRIYFNLNYLWSLLLMKYFPYLAFYRFGIKQSFVNIFVEDPKDETKPKPNSEYQKVRILPWYKQILSFFW